VNLNKLLVSPDADSEDDTAILTDLYEQLQCKQELIAPLDAKILKATKDNDAIKAEDVNITISTAKDKIENC